MRRRPSRRSNQPTAGSAPSQVITQKRVPYARFDAEPPASGVGAHARWEIAASNWSDERHHHDPTGARPLRQVGGSASRSPLESRSPSTADRGHGRRRPRCGRRRRGSVCTSSRRVSGGSRSFRRSTSTARSTPRPSERSRRPPRWARDQVIGAGSPVGDRGGATTFLVISSAVAALSRWIVPCLAVAAVAASGLSPTGPLHLKCGWSTG